MTLIISDACLVLCLKAGNMKADRHFQGGPVLFPGSETEVQRPSLQFLPALLLQPGCPSKQMGPLHAAGWPRGWPVPLTQEPPSPASDPPGLKSPLAAVPTGACVLSLPPEGASGRPALLPGFPIHTRPCPRRTASKTPTGPPLSPSTLTLLGRSCSSK